MLKGKEIKERLKRGDTVTSVMLRFDSPETAEMLALMGMDLIVIDNEHYPFDPETMIAIARAAHAGGAACVVRLPRVDEAQIKQVMDYGMEGIWIPSVDSYEEAKALVESVKFAPVGKRGFCPITRAASYGVGMTPQEYARLSNENSICVAQIETREGVEDLDRILSIEEIDMISAGPSDLSASYGHPGEYDHPSVVQALQTIEEKSKAAGKVTGGMYHDAEAVKRAYDQGVRYISFGSDQQMLMNELKTLTAVTNAFREKKGQ